MHKNLPMQYTEMFSPVQIKNFIENDILTIFAQNIDCGYTLEPTRQGDSNQYPQSMFLIKNTKNKKNSYTLVNHIRNKEIVHSKELVIILSRLRYACECGFVLFESKILFQLNEYH